MKKGWSARWRVGAGRHLVTGAMAAATWVVASPARAEDSTSENAEPLPPPAPAETATQERRGPHTANSIQLGLGFRYGVKLSDGDLNPWGTGLGIDVGYTLPNAIYLGGNFEYFFGDSSEALGFKVSANILQFNAEGGYDVGLGQSFVIRPKLGVGVAHFESSIEGCPAGVSCSGSSDTKAALAPGVTFLLFTQAISITLDVRYDMVLTDPSLKGLIFSAGVGF